MFLTKEEEKMLNGEMGEAKRKAMEIIVKLGDFFGAE
ncbi:MAG: aconitase X, partial [Thermoplasmata archaeon]